MIGFIFFVIVFFNVFLHLDSLHRGSFARAFPACSCLLSWVISLPLNIYCLNWLNVIPGLALCQPNGLNHGLSND